PDSQAFTRLPKKEIPVFQSLHPRLRLLLFSPFRNWQSSVAIGGLMVLAACQFEPPPASSPQSSSQEAVTVELQLRSIRLAKSASAPRPTDSAVITVSAPDMDSRTFRFGSGTDYYSLPEL